MHAVLLGVTKKLLILWTTEKKCEYSLNKNQILQITKRINNIGQLPDEFARKPRELIHLRRYKATELRQLLLYTLPVISKGIVKQKFYNHFMLLHSAIRILCSQNTCVAYNHIAASSLKKFVGNFPKLYGIHQVKFNVHSLLHLSDDVIFTQKPLDSFSSFKFENHLQILKKEARNCYRTLEQIINRTVEKNLIKELFPIESKNTVINLEKRAKNGQLKYVIINDNKYSIFAPNNFIYISNEQKVFKINEIIEVSETKITLEGQYVLKLKHFYKDPIRSSLVGVYYTISKLIFEKSKKIYVYKNDLKKVAKFAVNNATYFFTLIH